MSNVQIVVDPAPQSVDQHNQNFLRNFMNKAIDMAGLLKRTTCYIAAKKDLNADNIRKEIMATLLAGDTVLTTVDSQGMLQWKADLVWDNSRATAQELPVASWQIRKGYLTATPVWNQALMGPMENTLLWSLSTTEVKQYEKAIAAGQMPKSLVIKARKWAKNESQIWIASSPKEAMSSKSGYCVASFKRSSIEHTQVSNYRTLPTITVESITTTK